MIMRSWANLNTKCWLGKGRKSVTEEGAGIKTATVRPRNRASCGLGEVNREVLRDPVFTFSQGTDRGGAINMNKGIDV